MGYIGQTPSAVPLDGSDIADDIVDSQHYAAGSIDTEHIADVNVTTGKIANDAITLAKMAAGTDGNIISYDASGNPVAIATGTDGQVLTSTGAGSAPAFEAIPAAEGAFESELIHVEGRKSNGTNGGTFTNGAERTRELSDVVTNEITGASLGSNQITIPSGDYICMAYAHAGAVAANRVQLYNTTNSAILLTGSSETGTWIRSTVSGKFTISGTKVIELRHRCTTTKNTNGLGSWHNFGSHELYASVKLWKVG
jgi:hypothetical protein